MPSQKISRVCENETEKPESLQHHAHHGAFLRKTTLWERALCLKCGAFPDSRTKVISQTPFSNEVRGISTPSCSSSADKIKRLPATRCHKKAKRIRQTTRPSLRFKSIIRTEDLTLTSQEENARKHHTKAARWLRHDRITSTKCRVASNSRDRCSAKNAILFSSC